MTDEYKIELSELDFGTSESKLEKEVKETKAPEIKPEIKEIGVFDAAKEKNGYAIGVDVDQNYLNPDVIITSAEKKLTEATFLTVKSVIDGNFQGGTNITYGLKEGGVGISDFHNFADKIPQEIKDALAKAIEDIINGTVVVPATRAEAGYKM